MMFRPQAFGSTPTAVELTWRSIGCVIRAVVVVNVASAQMAVMHARTGYSFSALLWPTCASIASRSASASICVPSFLAWASA